mgnify:CR=1 FL=1
MEGRYMDLVSSYRDERHAHQAQSEPQQPAEPANAAAIAGGADGSGSQRSGPAQSEEIIRELESERFKFEIQVKELLSDEKHQSKRGGKRFHRDEEITRFNRELEGVFRDVVDSIDDAQVK